MRRLLLGSSRPTGWMLIALLLLGSSLAVADFVSFGPIKSAEAAPISYTASLSGPAESPPNNSPGTGSTQVDLNLAAHTLRVQVTFSGLQGPTTASHIHACTATP